MRRERWFGAAGVGLLSFGAALGALGCLCSGMEIEVRKEILLLILGFGAGIAGLCGVFRLYWVLPAASAAAAVIGFQPILNSLRSMLQGIANTYHQAYGWGVPGWLQGQPEDPAWGLCWIGLLLISAVVAAVMSGRGIAAAIMVCVLPVLPCCVVTDRVPSEGDLYLLLLPLLLLILSQHVRRRGFRKWTVSVLYLILPVALGLSLLFRLLPQEDYRLDKDASDLKKTVITMIQEQEWLSDLLSDAIIKHLAQKEQVDLSGFGENPELGLQVMSVKAPTSGYLYLRGCTYDTYTGLGWENSGLGAPEDYTVQGEIRYMTIRTKQTLDVLYLPYVAEALPGTVRNGRLDNTDQVREYNLAYRELTPIPADWQMPEYAYPEAILAACLQLPDETRAWSVSAVPEQVISLLAAGKVQTAALVIGNRVRSSAVYDRMTGTMPSGTTDFAKWFLEQSDKGYCVHFATAATVLLRAAGIPARYVTGYVVQAERNLFAEVTTDQAHAWVEYYVPEVGWQILEVSPVEGVAPPTIVLLPTETPEDIYTQPGTTEPSETENTTPTVPKEPVIPEKEKTFLWGLLVVVALLLIPGQWQFRLWLHKRRKTKGSTNARLLARWREAERLCRVQRKKPSQALHTLAQKARFSQYTISMQELQYFDRELDTLRSGLKTIPLWQRIVLRLVFALY